MPDFTADPAQNLLQKLRRAGAPGLPASKLLARKTSRNRASDEQALQQLLNQRAVANLGTPKTPRYVLIEFFKPLEMACAAIESKASADKIRLFTLAALISGTKGAVRETASEAVHWLVQEHTLIPVKHRQTTYYLFSSAIRDWLGQEPTLSPASTAFDECTLRSAYNQLVQETGLPDVRISDLHRVSGLDLEQLKSWLIAQSRAGQIAPSRGDWSLASDEQRDAAIRIGNEPFLKVRLL